MAIAVIVVFGLGGACGGGSKDARQPRSTASETPCPPASTTSKVTPAPTEATTTTTAKDETSTTTSMLADSAPLKAFEGSGVWIDVYEWSPSSTDGPPGVTPDQVADMAAAGMTTLYIQSARTSRAVDVADPERFREFVDASHAHGMDVVSWYLPNHTDPETDLRRLPAPSSMGSMASGSTSRARTWPIGRCATSVPSIWCETPPTWRATFRFGRWCSCPRRSPATSPTPGPTFLGPKLPPRPT